MPDAPGLELIAHEVNERHQGAIVGSTYEHGQAALLADLRDAPAHEYRFLASLHAADYLPAEPRFAVHYELLNMPRVERLRVKALVPDTENGSMPELDSVVEIFPT